MTDTEIVKALECCTSSCREIKCNSCLAFVDCRCTLKPKMLLDLINRQKAEIEGWKEAFNNLDKIARPSIEHVENVKAEAIREFAEKLKANMTQIRCGSYKYNVITEHGIDYYVKEMVGEGNEMQNAEVD